MTKPQNNASGLHYFGTDEDVRLGDRVQIRRWLRKPLLGTVCYIPGLSQNHKAIGELQWAIRGDNGTIWAMGYDPPRFQPKRDIQLISRGVGGAIEPDERIDEWQDDADEDQR